MPRSACLTSSFSLSFSSRTISLNLSRENYRSLMSRGNTSFLLINFKLLPSNLFITSPRQCWKMSIKACQSDVTPVNRKKNFTEGLVIKFTLKNNRFLRERWLLSGALCVLEQQTGCETQGCSTCQIILFALLSTTHITGVVMDLLWSKRPEGIYAYKPHRNRRARTHIHTQTHKEKRTYFQFKHICTDLRTAVDERGGCAPNGSECLQASVINMTESLDNFLFSSPLTAHHTS